MICRTLKGRIESSECRFLIAVASTRDASRSPINRANRDRARDDDGSVVERVRRLSRAPDIYPVDIDRRRRPSRASSRMLSDGIRRSHEGAGVRAAVNCVGSAAGKRSFPERL